MNQFKKIYFKYLILFLSLCSTPASSESIIRCISANKKDIIDIVLGEERRFGRVLNCIHGEFIFDMTPCAPANGYGLSYPTGSPALRKVVDRWQDYGDHLGGVVSNFISSTNITFEGGWMNPEDGYKDMWKFNIDRLSGNALLAIIEDKKNSQKQYKCLKTKKVF